MEESSTQTMDEENKILTPNGKEIRMKKDAYGIRLVFYPGGEVPQSLQGYFTSEEFAKSAIMGYLNAKSEG